MLMAAQLPAARVTDYPFCFLIPPALSTTLKHGETITKTVAMTPQSPFSITTVQVTLPWPMDYLMARSAMPQAAEIARCM